MNAPHLPPVVGIIGSAVSELPVTSPYYDAFHTAPALYSDCIIRAGGVPVILPPVQGDLSRILDGLDAIIFTGGTDLHPKHYNGNEQHPNLIAPDDGRDQMELALIKQALVREDLPIFCVCRGLQLLNIALGGTLTEHVPDLGHGDIHRSEDGLWTLHDVKAEPGTKLAGAMKATDVCTMSGHHQAIRALGAGLVAVANAPDGIIEAIDYTAHPWCLAVQWHPEVTAGRDETQQALFDTLVERALLRQDR